MVICYSKRKLTELATIWGCLNIELHFSWHYWFWGGAFPISDLSSKKTDIQELEENLTCQ